MRKMLAALIGAAASVTMMTGTGVASAAAGQPAGASVAGTESFQLVGNSLTGNNSKVIGYGVFNASGTDQPISNSKDIFSFPGGSFQVTHKPTRTRQHFNPATCSGTVFQRGGYTLGRGHGKFAGISGHGRYVLHVLIITRHTAHGCSQKPIAEQTIIQAHGPVALP